MQPKPNYQPANQRLSQAVNELVVHGDLTDRLYHAWIHLGFLGKAGVILPSQVEREVNGVRAEMAKFDAPELNNWIASLEIAGMNDEARRIIRWYAAIQ